MSEPSAPVTPSPPSLRLLLLTRDRFPPFRVDVKVLFAEQIASLGHRIDWLLQSDGPLSRSEVVSFGGGQAWVGAAAYGSGTVSRVRRFLQQLRNDLRVFSLTSGTRYDYVQAKDKFVGALMALAAARMRGTRFAYWLSFPFPEAWLHTANTGAANYPFINRIRGHLFGFLLYRIILPRADLIFVQSEQMKQDVAAEGIEDAKMRVVPMGIEQSLLQGFDASAVQSSQPTLLYLGIMTQARKIEFVIDAFARVLDRIPNARLVMVGGEHDDVERLAAHARAAGIAGRVEFTGKLPQREAWDRVRAAHVCLSPFHPTPILNSTSPTKLIEYMALGRPVIANHHPEQTRVISESEAGLCVEYTPAAFADAAVQLLENPILAQEMGRKGHEYAKRRSYCRIAADVVAHYQKGLMAP